MITFFITLAIALAFVFWVITSNPRHWPLAAFLAVFSVVWIGLAWEKYHDNLGYAVHFDNARSIDVEVVTQFEYGDAIYMTVRHLDDTRLRTYYFPKPTDEQRRQQEKTQQRQQQGQMVIGNIDPEGESPFSFKDDDEQRNKGYNELKDE